MVASGSEGCDRLPGRTDAGLLTHVPVHPARGESRRLISFICRAYDAQPSVVLRRARTSAPSRHCQRTDLAESFASFHQLNAVARPFPPDVDAIECRTWGRNVPRIGWQSLNVFTSCRICRQPSPTFYRGKPVRPPMLFEKMGKGHTRLPTCKAPFSPGATLLVPQHNILPGRLPSR